MAITMVGVVIVWDMGVMVEEGITVDMVVMG